MASFYREEEAYTREDFSHYQNILNNGSARIPICFCIDVSASMGFLTNPDSDLIVTGHGYSDGVSIQNVKLKNGVIKKTKLDDLKRVLKRLIVGLKDNLALREAAVVSIVTFSRYADTVINFCEPASLDWEKISQLIRIGVDETNVSEGINLSVKKLKSMSKVLADAQAESFKPVFILISDGTPTDNIKADDAVYTLLRMANNDEITVLPIGIYLDPDGREWLGRLRTDHETFIMNNDGDFDRVFGMIEDMIVYKAASISVDENIMRENKFARETDIPTTAYGGFSALEELLNLNYNFEDDI